MIHELGEQLQAFMFASSVESCLISKNFNSNVFPHVAHGLRNMRCWRTPAICASRFVRNFGPLCIPWSMGSEDAEWNDLLWIADIWKEHSKMQVLTTIVPWIVKQIKLAYKNK